MKLLFFSILIIILALFIFIYPFKITIYNDNKYLYIKISFIMALMFSYMWETLEHYLEVGLWGNVVSYWLQGVEHWSNRLICDNLMVMLGWWIYQQKNKIVWFARGFSIVWLFVHIFIFPHSMYLHELF